jgi:hypothetical protein
MSGFPFDPDEEARGRGEKNADGTSNRPAAPSHPRATYLPFAKFNTQAIWISDFGTFGHAERDWAERYSYTFIL